MANFFGSESWPKMAGSETDIRATKKNPGASGAGSENSGILVVLSLREHGAGQEIEGGTVNFPAHQPGDPRQSEDREKPPKNPSRNRDETVTALKWVENSRRSAGRHVAGVEGSVLRKSQTGGEAQA